MNRNSFTRFSRNPASINIRRSDFVNESSTLTSCNAGDLVPVYCREVLPGDSVVIDSAVMLRSSTLRDPVMDDAFADLYYFFVPNRLVWEHWKNFMGENDVSAWAPSVEYKVPTVSAIFGEKSIADYFGIPTKTASAIEVSALPFRAYRLIWNEWFRSEALEAPKLVNDGDVESDTTIYGSLLKTAKLHDYFTSALPSPQRGASVSLPLIGDAPVITGTQFDVSNNALMTFDFSLPLQSGNYVLGTQGSGSGLTSSTVAAVPTSQSFSSTSTGIRPNNLYADMSNVSGATITQLRQASAIQRLLEADARGGGRYREIVQTHFGVNIPDATVQVPEYLGGRRINLRTQEVVQNSGSVSDGNTTEYLGDLAAYSKTVDKGHICSKSFSEHGFVIGLMTIRTHRRYQQGIPRQFSRKSRFDFYWPSLAHISEQPIYNREIYADGSASDAEVFGYKEPWAEYKHTESIATAEMRSNAEASMDSWHYGDDYESVPALSAAWIHEPTANVDRTLAVSSSASDQFKVDCYNRVHWFRPMPLYSVPGLAPHF